MLITWHKKTQTIKHTAGVHVAKIRNDNFCDCSDCADEVNWNCDTCGAFDGDDGEEATDVGSVRGGKIQSSGARKGRDAEKESPLLCVFCLSWFCWTGRFAHSITCWNTILLSFLAVKDFCDAIYLFQWFAKTQQVWLFVKIYIWPSLFSPQRNSKQNTN